MTARQSARPHGPQPRYVNAATQRILACYPGQVPAAVIERAMREMAARDGHTVAKTRKTSGGRA